MNKWNESYGYFNADVRILVFHARLNVIIFSFTAQIAVDFDLSISKASSYFCMTLFCFFSQCWVNEVVFFIV